MFWRSLILTLSVVSQSLAEPPKKVLLIGQLPDGHPADTHEYNAGMRVLARLLKAQAGLEVLPVRGDEPWKDGPELLDRVDGAVIFVSEGAKWVVNDPKRLAAFQRLGARGGGLAVIHWGMGTRDAGPIEPFVKLFGGCHGGPDRKYRVVEEAIQIADPKHPATTGVAGLRLQEEWYYRLKFVKPEGSVRPLVQVTIDGQPETVSWAWERPDGGRSFGFSGLHFHGNWQQPAYRRLIGQAVLWTLKLPIPKDGLPVDIAADELKVQKEDRP
jgi:hypothetical protein